MALKTMFPVCIILSCRHLCAATLILNNVAAFACSRGMHPYTTWPYKLQNGAAFQLQTQSTKQMSSQLLELMNVGALGKRKIISRDDINLMHDFNANLANQIKDGLAGM